MEKLAMPSRSMCPHCDMPMELFYVGAADGFRYICQDGCKAEYAVTLAIGSTTEIPVCGAKRVQTYGQ